MELLDSGKNDENSGYFSRRRISSILKDPRKSTRFSDPEQQENEVECAKRVGKRNSRRVSFAPANDVLLYSKDVKHASPVRGPFQELMSTAIPAQNGVQGSVGEEGIIQQIMGMEPLITAPLHAYDVKGNANFELGEGFGEKTVMYNEDDDFMEMTQSHTINIADTDDYRVDCAQKNRPTLLSCGKKSTMSSANGESMDMSLSHNTNIARELEMPCAGQITDFSVMSSVLSLDPSFNNLLRSKSHGSNVRQHKTTFETKMSQIKTQKVDVDKENQAPILVHSETGKSPHNGKNIGLSHDDDGKMDVTVTHTDHVAGLNDDPDDPFQCLFPQQEMYSQCDTASQARHTKITVGSSNPKAAAFGNRLEKENAGEATLQIADKNSLKNHSFHALQEQRDNSKEKSTEKATGFIADDTCLDTAQSCTAKITGALSPPPAPNFNHFLCEGKTALLAPSMEKKHRATIGHPLSSRISLDPKFEKFLANIFKTDGPRVNPGHARMTQVNPLVRANEQPFNGDPMHPKEDLSMKMTEFQRDIVTRIDKPLQCLLPTQLIHPKGQQATFHQLFSDEQRSSYHAGKEIGTSDNSNLDVTQSGSVNTPRIFTMQSRKILDSLPSSDERTVRFTANDAAMDMTQSLTVNIDLPFEPGAHKSVPLINAGGENTIRFSANDAAMDITQNLTTIIDTHSETGVHKEVRSAPTGGEKPIRFSANDAAMGMTQSLTAMIDTPFEAGANKSVPFVHAGGENTIRFSANDAAMDMTQNLTTIIDTLSETGAHKEVNSVPQGGEKTIRFSANDTAMDMTQSLTVNIDLPFEPSAHKSVPFINAGGENTIRFSANDAAMDMTQSLTAMIDTPFEGGAPKSVPFVHAGGENTIRFSANDAAMDMTQNLTTIIDTLSETGAHKEVNSVPQGGEKTIRFSANDTAMDMTQSLTVNIDLPFEPSAHKSVPFINAGGENTIRFSANDAAMDITQSLTAMIDTPFEGGAPKSVPFVHAGGENTIRFSANDAAMDMTQNLTTIIDTQSESGTHKEVHSVPNGGEKTTRFSANDAAMDMTQSLTAMIDTPFEAGANKSVPFVHAGGENTIRFSANDAAMDMTQSLTAMIDTPLDPEAHKNHSVATGGEKNINFSASDAAMDVTQRKRSSSVLSFNPGQNIFCNTGFPWPHRVVTKVDPPAEASFGEAVDTNCFMPAQLKTLYMDDKSKVPGVTTLHDSLLSTQKNADGTLHGVDVSINPTDVQTDSSTQRPYADVRGTQEMTSQQTSQELGRDVEESPDAVNSEETQSRKEAESRNKTSSLSQKLNSPGAGDDGRDSSQSARFRIADLQLKVRRLSQMVSATSETNLEPDTDKNTKEEHNESEFVPDVQPGLRDTEDEDTRYGPQGYTAVGTPFKFKTPELMSRLSTRGFKPKLPQRSRADEPKKTDSASGISQEKSAGRTATDVTSTLNKWNDDDVSDIYDEELGSCEDLSDTLDNKILENAIPFEDFNVYETSTDNVFQENSPNSAQGIKRRLPSDENQTGDEKKMKASGVMLPEAVATEIPAHVPEYDRVNTTTVPSSNQTMDSSNSTLSNSSRSDATFNSTFKHSMLESHLEDRDMQKLNDGSITALEFFKLFNIDFVIHKPRQSVLPSRVPRGTGCSAIDVLKNRHINHPKRIVYEADFEIVSQKMEGLNCRILDLNKPLKVINQDLWADVKKSSEKEIRSLGVKLKERNNFFRKMSKVRAHEMKAVLYSSLVQTLGDEQQKFKSAVESNEMIQILDDCIGDLEAELAAVEEKGTENMSSLKSLQEEMKKFNEALDDKNRQLHELEVQKKQASGKLSSLKAETRNLESFIGTLHTLTEWRFREKTENYTVYTFLNDTLHLQLVHAGNGAEKEPERKTAQVNFQFLLHDENSENHACLVHKLLSQHIKGETAWVERYPTSSCIPKLLHDVSSVVSTCRLLGEELRMLKMWGGLRLNIMDICCEDTRVNLVFSSLRKRCKFEVTLSVTLANHLYVLQVHGFNNVIGDTTAKQIERIVESFTPAKKLLTKTVKKINCDVLG